MMSPVALILLTAACVAVSVYAIYQTIISRRNITSHVTAIREHLNITPQMVASKTIPIVSLTREDLGKLEGAIPNLETVIVVADEVDRPTNSLMNSVRTNLVNGVRYIFLVSQSKAEREMRYYYQNFVTEANIVRDKLNVERSVSEMVEIQQLSTDWKDFPYIFYRYRQPSPTDEEGGQLRTFALRGNQIGTGIATQYDSIPPEVSHTLANAIMSQAPTSLVQTLGPMEKAEFKDSINVIKGAFNKTAAA